MDASFWNLIGDPTALHFLRRNYALVSYRKAREFAVGRRCSQPIRLSVRNSTNLNGRDAALRRPGPERAKNPPGKCPSPDSDPFSNAEF